jgi:DNA helicase-2/ATP-dependent DNA helicase PcrA
VTSSRIQKAVDRFADMIKTFGSEVEGKNAYDAGLFIAKNSGILKAIDDEKDTPEGKARKENVEELMSAMQAFTEEPEREDISLSAFMADVALITDMDNKNTNQDAVTMMTVHGAKGLEFPYIYVVGLEENLFPSQMALQERSDLEEERRLFYVAVTRAQEKLFLSYATSRFRWGKLVYAEPSRFIEEIDPQYLDYDVATAEAQQAASQMNPQAGGGVNGVSTKGKSAPKAITHQPSPNFAPEDLTDLQTGMEVEHNRFGFGTVTKIEGEGDNRKAAVDFKNIGEKRILLKYAKMKILRQE